MVWRSWESGREGKASSLYVEGGRYAAHPSRGAFGSEVELVTNKVELPISVNLRGGAGDTGMPVANRPDQKHAAVARGANTMWYFVLSFVSSRFACRNLHNIRTAAIRSSAWHLRGGVECGEPADHTLRNGDNVMDGRDGVAGAAKIDGSDGRANGKPALLRTCPH